MLLMFVSPWDPVREQGWVAGGQMTHAGDATPGETSWPGENASVSSHGATDGSAAALHARGSGLGGLLAELAPQDLAHVGLGQLGAEFDVLGLLVPGQVLARVRLDLFGRQPGVLADDDDLDRFARLLVGHADRADLEHAGQHGD